jgi:hypothetical protein
MRIVISAPRKSGGAHLRCLLSMAYDLKAPPVSAPEQEDQAGIAAWLASLPEKSVTTCDLPHSLLAACVPASDVRLVGVIRHPFDLFVSNYDVAQQRATRGRDDDEGDRSWNILSGEDLDSEAAWDYATTGFASDVRALMDWTGSGSAVRYEDLLADPTAVITSLSFHLGPLTEEQVRHAESLCPAENVVLSRPGRGRRMPALPPGAWRERLPATLLETLRARYAPDVAALGYDAN